MYTVSVLFKSLHNDEKSANPKNLCEEIIYLIDAISSDDAEEKAKIIAKNNECSYQNVDGEMINWTFEKIIHVCPLEIEEFNDGTEIFSRFLNTNQARTIQKEI